MPARSSPLEVVVIGDAHDSSKLPDKSRFRWIGKEIRRLKPDWVVSIGDLATLDSLCSHEKNETLAGKRKPSFVEDMASLRCALEAINLPDGLPRHVTLGNHEDRCLSFTNRHPETEGMMEGALIEVLAAYDWTWSRFGEVWTLGGVDFTHMPLTVMGKPMGGENPGPRLARIATTDMVVGHDHLVGVTVGRKIGHRSVRVFQVGCALPSGHIEDYARHALTGWHYGIMHLTLGHGRVTDWAFSSMDALKERWG